MMVATVFDKIFTVLKKKSFIVNYSYAEIEADVIRHV